MRWDVPTRIAFLIGAPLIWIAVAGIDPSAIGLNFGLAPLDWSLIALWSVGVALVTLSYRRWLWPVRAVAGRSALPLDLPFFLVLNPVAEELFFRGAAMFGLANLIGMPWAIVVTSLVFGLHHGLDRQFPRSFLVLGTLGGLLFGIAAAHFESVAPAIVLHVAADAVIFVTAAPILERLGVGLRMPLPPSPNPLAPSSPASAQPGTQGQRPIARLISSDPVAQLDRACGCGPQGRRFESSRGRPTPRQLIAWSTSVLDGQIPRRRIGASDLQAGTVGVGTWQWGDRTYWDDHDGQEPTDVSAAYNATIQRGADFLDTAELYGFGESERVIGRLRADDTRPAVVATKYMPAPTRWRVRSVDAAIDGSLERLGVDQIDLYQVHWPYSLIPHQRLLRRLALAVHDGRLRYIGVSNFTAPQLRRAYAVLAAAGVPLVSNQVSYSLLRRAPEVNGVLDACRELDVTLIAYSPLAQGC